MQDYLKADNVELPENLTVIRQAEFNGVVFDFFDDAVTNEIYVCDEQIGVALEYEPPVAKVIDLHRRHEKQIEPHSLETHVTTLRGTKTVDREVWLYTLRGVCEMCRWAKQPKVDDFLDFMWKEIETIRREKARPIIQQEEMIDRAAQRLAQILFPQFTKTLSAQIVEQLRRVGQIDITDGPEQVLTLTEDVPLSALPNTLTVLHIQNYLDMGKVQAYELMHSEGFPSFTVGRSVKVEKRKFEKWLDKMAGTAHVPNK